MSKILSLDVSTSSSGYAFFDGKELITYGCIKSDKKEFRERIADMVDEIDKIVKKLNPDFLICEDVPLISRNPQTLKILCCLQGALLGMTIGNKKRIEFIMPSTWRKPCGLFDGTKDGTTRKEMKRKSIELANKQFSLNLIYKTPTSKFNQDDEADSINLGASYQGVYEFEEKPKKTIGRKVNL